MNNYNIWLILKSGITVVTHKLICQRNTIQAELERVTLVTTYHRADFSCTSADLAFLFDINWNYFNNSKMGDINYDRTHITPRCRYKNSNGEKIVFCYCSSEENISYHVSGCSFYYIEESWWLFWTDLYLRVICRCPKRKPQERR